MSNTDTLTAEEAAKELGVTPSRVRQMIRAGDLPAQRFGKVHVITRAALKIAEQRKTKPGPVPKAKTEKAIKKRGKK
ncbi:MAG: helix-turn-helix domain-containing protein [Pyrinomonadaceae bacterium]